MSPHGAWSANAINAELAKQNQILFSQTAQLQHLATLRLEWLAAHETLSLSALGLVNFTTREWLVTPRIGYRFSDAITIHAGRRSSAARPTRCSALIDDQLTAGYAELRYTF